MCIAYSYVRECGKHVNLRDWHDAFAAVVDGRGVQPARGRRGKKRKKGGSANGGSDGSEAPSVQAQARWLQAVASLKTLGLVGSGSRKKGHVVKTAFNLEAIGW